MCGNTLNVPIPLTRERFVVWGGQTLQKTAENALARVVLSQLLKHAHACQFVKDVCRAGIRVVVCNDPMLITKCLSDDARAIANAGDRHI